MLRLACLYLISAAAKAKRQQKKKHLYIKIKTGNDVFLFSSKIRGAIFSVLLFIHSFLSLWFYRELICFLRLCFWSCQEFVNVNFIRDQNHRQDPCDLILLLRNRRLFFFAMFFYFGLMNKVVWLWASRFTLLIRYRHWIKVHWISFWFFCRHFFNKVLFNELVFLRIFCCVQFTSKGLVHRKLMVALFHDWLFLICILSWMEHVSLCYLQCFCRVNQ